VNYTNLDTATMIDCVSSTKNSPWR